MDATLLAITVLLYRVSYGEAAIAAVDADAIIKTAISRHNMLFLPVSGKCSMEKEIVQKEWEKIEKKNDFPVVILPIPY